MRCLTNLTENDMTYGAKTQPRHSWIGTKLVANISLFMTNVISLLSFWAAIGTLYVWANMIRRLVI